MRRVLFVGAHPDDIELGCGGTVACFSERGYETECIYLTNGERDTPVIVDHGQVSIGFKGGN